MTARRRLAVILLAALSVVSLSAMFVQLAGAADPIPGSQGTDTSLPLTESAVTVKGRDQFADLAITVNQTRNLTNQAVSITWEGGVPTVSGPGRFASNYLQVFQCWGDDDGTQPDNPGPPPEQCVQGGVIGTFPPVSVYPNGLAISREIGRSDWPNFEELVEFGGVYDARSTSVWMPFRSVDGTTVDIPVDPTFIPGDGGGNYWLNPYFNGTTTNEIAGARTGSDGRGAELMRLDTGTESSGLGCGQRVQPVGDGSRKIPQCWIVVVPRGEPIDQNAGSPFAVNADQFGVYTSPLYPAAWQNRIAIPVEFNPVDSPCSLADTERRIAGNELVLPAVSSWQPTLCSYAGLPPYSYASVGDTSARRQLTTPTSGSPGMVVVSEPIPPASVNAANPIVYAPLTASGIVIGFNIERVPRLSAPDDEQQLAGVRVAEVNLTPRLVAKLLTQSYSSQLDIFAPPAYSWLSTNAAYLAEDPDFLQFNPEFEYLSAINRRTFGGLQLPAGNSDAARQVWQWILADPEAREWMSGQADQWGMVVNPVYSVDAATNPLGVAFGTPVPDSFPKADSYCYVAPPRGPGGAPGTSVVPSAICGTDWMPYTRGLGDGARVVRDASDGARVAINDTAQVSSDVWKATPPQFAGSRSMLAVTDSASAAKFGLQTARLSQAGDNGPDRVFVASTASTLNAGLATMRPSAVPGVVSPSAVPGAAGADAYPLTAITYAAIAPLALDAEARNEYAAFLEYAAGAGQAPGLDQGNLPPGYVPLPDAMRLQTAAAAVTVRELVPVEPPSPTTTQPPPPPTGEAETPTPTPTPEPTVPVSAETGGSPPSQSPPFAGQSGSPSSGRSSGSRGGTTPTSPVEGVAVESVVPLPPDTAPEPLVAPQEPVGDEEVEPAGSSIVTPLLAVGRSRYAVPGLAVVALGSALGALEITKRPRRRADGSADQLEIMSGELEGLGTSNA